MKRIYLYPLTARTEKAVINPYIGNLRDALNTHFEVINAYKPSKTGIFDILKYLHKVDVVYFNWSEEVPELHRGRIQAVFLLLLLPYLRLSRILIIWTLHNKESHFNRYRWLKKRLYHQMLKKSDLIITHAKEGLKLIPNGKKASFLPHPVRDSIIRNVKDKKCHFDLIIWGTIAPYKGITEFLNFLEMEEIIGNYRILMAGKVTSQSLGNELRAYESKYENLVLMDGYVEEKRLIDLVHDSKIALFTYQSESILSSGALMDSLSYGATIVGPAAGAFNDLNELGLIETYSDFQSLREVLNRLLASSGEDFSRHHRIREFMAANSWSEYSKMIQKLIEQLNTK
jgi:glycosyltransferase involved in cell wall biosynthesis